MKNGVDLSRECYFGGSRKWGHFVHFGLVGNDALNFPVSLSRIVFGYNGSWNLPFRVTQILT